MHCIYCFGRLFHTIGVRTVTKSKAKTSRAAKPLVKTSADRKAKAKATVDPDVMEDSDDISQPSKETGDESGHTESDGDKSDPETGGDDEVSVFAQPTP